MSSSTSHAFCHLSCMDNLTVSVQPPKGQTHHTPFCLQARLAKQHLCCALQLPALSQLSKRNHKTFWKQNQNITFPRFSAEGFLNAYIYIYVCKKPLTLLTSFAQLPRASPCWLAVALKQSIFKTYQNLQKQIYLVPALYAQNSFHR